MLLLHLTRERPSPSQRSASAIAPVKRQKRGVDFGNDITVLVGKHEKRFVAHKNVLCGSSGFLKDALKSGRWKEGKERIIRFPEQPPTAFNV